MPNTKSSILPRSRPEDAAQWPEEALAAVAHGQWSSSLAGGAAGGGGPQMVEGWPEDVAV
jgi:hypothetical protein